MITIKSIRKGYANNSSSSHSIIMVSEEKFKELEDDSNHYQYGWEQFVVKSRKEKESYLFTNFICALQHHIRIDTNLISYEAERKIRKNTCIEYLEENKKIFSFEYFDDLMEEFKSADSFDMYVDHQSVWDIPVDENNKINAEFYSAFCKEILEKNYVILGGNDNSDSDEDGHRHPLGKFDIGVSEIVSLITNNTPW